jgi:hypothetical protein
MDVPLTARVENQARAAGKHLGAEFRFTQDLCFSAEANYTTANNGRTVPLATTFIMWMAACA